MIRLSDFKKQIIKLWSYDLKIFNKNGLVDLNKIKLNLEQLKLVYQSFRKQYICPNSKLHQNYIYINLNKNLIFTKRKKAAYTIRFNNLNENLHWKTINKFGELFKNQK